MIQMIGYYLIRVLAYLWASPYTLAALLFGWVCSLYGTTIERIGPVVVCYGGPLQRILGYAPIQGGAAAMTFGHCLLARDRNHLLSSYDHELVHVRQYEWWGPFFVPAYALVSIWLWLWRKDAYRGNPFERQAFAADEERRQHNCNR